MNNRETWVSRFYIYPKEIAKFIEYCERFQCIQNTKIVHILDEEKDTYNPKYFTYRSAFVADVTFYSELDSLRFINVFSLFFTLSKYCSRI